MPGYAHNGEGVYEFYFQLLNTKSFLHVNAFLKFLMPKFFKRHWPCYCQSGKAVRDCHLNLILNARKNIYRKDAAISYGMAHKHLRELYMRSAY